MHSARLAPAVVLLIIVGCGSPSAQSTGDPSVAPTASPEATRIAVRTPRPTPTLPPGIAQVIDLNGEELWGVATAGGTVWVEGSNLLHQIDGATGRELQSMPGYIPTVVGDTLWFQRDADVVAADALTGAERAVYTPPMTGGTQVRDGILWAINEMEHSLARIDLATATITGRVSLPEGEPKWVEVWEDAVWVVIDGSDVVLRIDPETLTVTHTIDGGSRPHSVAVGFGSLWVIEHGMAEVIRISPDGTVAATIDGPGINVAMAITEDAVWASSRDALLRIDPATNQVVDTIDLGSSEYYGMAYSQGSLWVTTGMAHKGILQIPIP